MKHELKKGDEPVLIFIHQLLGGSVDETLFVNNHEEIRTILEESGRVLAVFQGHHHAGDYIEINSIPYITIQGAVEGEYAENTSYAVVEVLEDNTIRIDGFGNCLDRVCVVNPTDTL